jgi:hypothetical protein
MISVSFGFASGFDVSTLIDLPIARRNYYSLMPQSKHWIASYRSAYPAPDEFGAGQ